MAAIAARQCPWYLTIAQCLRTSSQRIFIAACLLNDKNFYARPKRKAYLIWPIMVPTGGIHAAPESFFPTLPSLSTLVEDAAEGFSNLFIRTPSERRSSDETEDGPAGMPLHCYLLFASLLIPARLSITYSS